MPAPSARKGRSTPPPGGDVEERLAGFIDASTPQIAACLRACRAHLQGLFPRGFELVYDNYNALVLAYGPSGRASELLVSLAAYPRWVTLFFAQGASLDDPEGLLRGDGARIRSIRLQTPGQLLSAPVKALLAQALAPAEDALSRAPALTTLIQAVSARQRPRRP